MQIKQVLAHLEEGWLPLLMGAFVGNIAHQKNFNGGLALLAGAATYDKLLKLAPVHRKTVVVTAKDQAEMLANHKIVQHMIDKMSYKLDSVDQIGTYGRKWTLTAK